MVLQYIMNSLISLLWQFQIPNSPIVTTILKNEYQKPQHYFYSQKQNRVLRKKNPNVMSLLQQEQVIQKDQKKTQYFPKEMNKGRKSKLLRIKRMKQSRISVDLCEHIVAMSQLTVQQYEGEFNIIEQDAQLILCSFGNEKKSDQINIQYLSCDPPYMTDLNRKQKQKAVQNFVKQLSNNILMSVDKRKGELNKRVLIQSENKYVNNSLLRLELILALNLNTKRNSIFIVDAIKLIFSQTDFVSIMYSPITNSKLINWVDGHALSVKNTKQQRRIQIPQIESKKISEQIDIFSNAKQKLSVRQCVCCENEGYGEFKEISNQQFKKGRKKRNLAMRGFHEEYYQVCRNCYEQL